MMRSAAVALAFYSSLVCSNGCAKATPPIATSGVGPTAASAGAPTPQAVRIEAETPEADGVAPERLHALFAPALETLHRCAPSSGGKINVRIANRNGRLEVTIEPGASLDPTLRDCVLQALSTVDVNEMGSNTAGPAPRPSGYTSLFAVSW